jgi:hypothetical protein
VPHELTILHKSQRVTETRKLLKILREDASGDFAHIMTGEESWFFYQYEFVAMFTRD